MPPSKPAQAAPVQTQPLPSNFSEAQAKKAVDALLKYHAKVSAEKEENELLPREEYVYLVINTKTGSTKKKVMPVKIALPNPPLPPPPATSVCLITKDPQRQYKDLLSSPEHNIKFINRVVGLQKLQGKFKPYEARRQLMRDHDIFLCDDRVLEKMPRLLGKIFFDAKKQPIPVNLSRKDLKAELGRAISSTYFHPSTGTSHSIRISTPSSTTPSQTLSNLLSAIPSVIAQIPNQWSNILSIGLKTSTSVLLPIYNCSLEGRFNPKDSDGDVEMSDKSLAQKGEFKRSAENGDLVEGIGKKVKSTIEESVSKSAEKFGVKSLKGKGDRKKSSTLSKGGAGKRAKMAVIGTA